MDELYPLLDLRNVRIYEISARRKDGFDDLEGTLTDPRRQDILVRIRATEDRLNYRCRIEVNTEKALLVADAEAQFALEEQIEQPPMELVNEFSRVVGLPIVVPYLRVQVQQLARQIGVPAPMLKPLWKPDFEEITIMDPHDDRELSAEPKKPTLDST